MNTKNSPEYQILKYLDTHQSDDKIDTSILSRALTNITEHEVQTTVLVLIHNNYVRYRENGIGLAIKEDGQKRLSKMQTDVDIEDLIQTTSSLNKTSKNVLDISKINIALTLILSLVTTIVSLRQCSFQEEMKQLEQSILSNSISLSNQTQEITIKLNDTISVKILSPSIKETVKGK